MSFTDPEKLLIYLGLDPKKFSQDIKARSLFPLRVPRPFAQKIEKGNPKDPLLLQVMTQKQEFLTPVNFNHDPLDEQNNSQAGILHKYLNRVLLLVKGGCAVNCRYCFRRHFPYQDNQLNKKDWEQALTYIANDKNIDEVIYSGGDPLMAKDDMLAWLTERITQLPHIKRLRIHTRLPVVIPARVTNTLIQAVTKSHIQTVIVVHVNHANEIDKHFKQAMLKLKQAGVTLFNQAVLLKDVNNSAEAQIALNEALFSAGVLPYYLHLLDKVQGAAHFDTAEQEARNIMAEVIKRQPGYLVPKLVREIGGQPGKTPVDLHLHP